MDKKQFSRDQIFFCVCNIRTPIGGTNEKTGTGMFVANNNGAYLVTAEHIAIDTNYLTYLVLCDKSGNYIELSLIQLNNTISWIHHKTEDLSALKIDVEKCWRIIAERCFPLDQIGLDLSSISRDRELTCVGFPCGLGSKGAKFSPFTFRSFLSSSLITLERADTKKPAEFLCLENPSVGGYSGGPIFDLGYVTDGNVVSSSGETKLIGIMHGTIFDDTGGKIAMITPAWFLKDLID